jgi:hypothetical protein
LLPAGGVSGLPYPRFEAGNYVLMRHDKRDNAFEWGRLQLDNNTGRLVYAQTTSDSNGQIVSRDPRNDNDLNYRSRKAQFDASGQRNMWQDRAGDYREQSYVTLQINALDPVPPAMFFEPPPPRRHRHPQAARSGGNEPGAGRNEGGEGQHRQ